MQVTRLEQLLERAQLAGLLSFFNGEYQRRRCAARAAGRGFMAYHVARQRLHDAVVQAIAEGGTPSRSLVARVFE